MVFSRVHVLPVVHTPLCADETASDPEDSVQFLEVTHGLVDCETGTGLGEIRVTGHGLVEGPGVP